MTDAPDSFSSGARPRPLRPPADGPRGGPPAQHAPDDDELPTGGGAAPALQISNAIVALHKRYLGRGPKNIKTHFTGDLVVVLLSGALTPVERTLTEEGYEDTVMDQRRAFQAVMAERFKAVVRETTGREVVAMLSANHVDPDLALETFVLGGPADGPVD